MRSNIKAPLAIAVAVVMRLKSLKYSLSTYLSNTFITFMVFATSKDVWANKHKE